MNHLFIIYHDNGKKKKKKGKRKCITTLEKNMKKLKKSQRYL